jgi:hypothetical protein
MVALIQPDFRGTFLQVCREHLLNTFLRMILFQHIEENKKLTLEHCDLGQYDERAVLL